LREPYGALLEQRYKWGHSPQAIAQMPEEDLLSAVARKRGALLPGGRINTQKAAEVLLVDFRSGALGPITLETPEEYEVWLREALRVEAERAEARQAERAAERQTQRAMLDLPEPRAAGRRSPRIR
jgi:ribosome biogenesis GTPase A